MTVKELKDKLRDAPDDDTILVAEYEESAHANHLRFGESQGGKTILYMGEEINL